MKWLNTALLFLMILQKVVFAWPCVTVSAACGDLPQHQSHGFMQVLHSNPGETSQNCCAHLETCAKQILPWSSSYNDHHHLNINCTFCKLCLCGFILLLHWGGINSLVLTN